MRPTGTELANWFPYMLERRMLQNENQLFFKPQFYQMTHLCWQSKRAKLHIEM